tara:strand:+ start:2354 stop:3142 length:789 start_codon:yes stop_codon:yes gene_type:complete
MKTKPDTANLLLSLKNYAGEDAVIDSFEMKSIVDERPELPVFNSAIPSLDKYLKGFMPGELIAMSGPRKAGKSLLAQTLTYNFFKHDVRSLWLQYELPDYQFINRFPELPLFVMPKKMRIYSMDWLHNRILESIAKYGVRVVFIDHLHYLFDIARSRNTSIEIGQVIRTLKTICIDLNITIFLICHMRKLDPFTEPSDDAVRDSSFVAQESDVGLMVWRDIKTEDQAWLKVCYSRRTGVLEKKVKLIKTDGFLKEQTDKWNI